MITALVAELKAVRESWYASNRAITQLEAENTELREVMRAAKELRKQFGSTSDRGVCVVFDAAIAAAEGVKR